MSTIQPDPPARSPARTRAVSVGTLLRLTAAAVLAAGIAVGFVPLSTRSTNGLTIDCGSAFRPVDIPVLVPGRPVGDGSGDGDQPSGGVFGQCDHNLHLERLVAVTTIAVGGIVLLVAAWWTRSPSSDGQAW